MTAQGQDGRRRRWVAIDIDLFCGSPSEKALYQRWGWCGVALWAAYIAACKRAPIEGRLRFHSEEEAACELGILGRPLEDAEGKPFTLREFFAWTGHRRWTRMRRPDRSTWPAVEWLGYEVHNRRRQRRPHQAPAQAPEQAPKEAPKEAPPQQNPGPTLAEPWQNPGNKPSSEGRNARADMTGQDSTTTGGAVPVGGGGARPAAGQPQGASQPGSGEPQPLRQAIAAALGTDEPPTLPADWRPPATGWLPAWADPAGKGRPTIPAEPLDGEPQQGPLLHQVNPPGHQPPSEPARDADEPEQDLAEAEQVLAEAGAAGGQ